ncbi:MAG: signal peptidase II [Inhella sp.]
MSTASTPAPGWSRWLLVAAVVIALDQLSKYAIVQRFALNDGQVVTSFFNLVRAHNPGAAFSFLAGAGGWQRWFFTALAAAATVFIIVMLRRHGRERLLSLALSLIMGGAIGNVIDRLWHGHVIDFLQFHWKGAAFPSFNIADSAITLGAILLIVDELRRMRAAKRQAAAG